eukprot:gb/GEZJ01000982.1/.p2 GENE.gb/GEZJ01000982.1/~~gb/GEZJ01000982.1/.p2  ORF type:complete len:106 (+),score=15.64 gb/GEZJ01000982.1/:194-511(+)
MAMCSSSAGVTVSRTVTRRVETMNVQFSGEIHESSFQWYAVDMAKLIVWSNEVDRPSPDFGGETESNLVRLLGSNRAVSGGGKKVGDECTRKWALGKQDVQMCLH